MTGHPSHPSPNAESLARLAREDLARELGLEPDQIRLISVEAVNWPDSSLGCPQPGMFYAQVLAPGYLIILGAWENRYEYHAGPGGSLVRCQPPRQKPS